MLCVLVALWCSEPATTAPLHASTPAYAATPRPPDGNRREDRGRRRVRAGAVVLVSLGVIALALAGLGLVMLTARWARRSDEGRRGPVHTEMEDLWSAAGKKDIPRPPGED